MEPQTAKTVGALVGTRTRDLILTKNVLCQLSYKGLTAGGAAAPGTRIAQGTKSTAMRTPRDTELYRQLACASSDAWRRFRVNKLSLTAKAGEIQQPVDAGIDCSDYERDATRSEHSQESIKILLLTNSIGCQKQTRCYRGEHDDARPVKESRFR
jgi:hypothetical protein